MESRSLKTLVLIALITIAVSGQTSPSEFGLELPVNSAEDVDVWPHFQWEQSTSSMAVTYDLYLSTSSTFEPAFTQIYANLDTNSFYPELDLVASDDLYFWKVRAHNTLGEEIWSTTSPLTTGFWVFQTINMNVSRELQCAQPLQANRTLRLENSPYILVHGNMIIPDGIKFEVRAGVELQIGGDFYIEVSGELRLLGAPGDSILITSAYETPAEGDWEDIRFTETATHAIFDSEGDYVSGSTIQYTIFEFAGSDNYLIRAPFTSMYITDCSLSRSSNPGGIWLENNKNYIANNTINDFSHISYGGDSFASGLYMMADSSKIMSNIVTNCNAKTLPDHFGSVIGSFFSSYGGGIYINGSSNVIETNTIRGSSSFSRSWFGSYLGAEAFGGGVYLIGSSNIVMSNDFFDCSVNADSRAGHDGGHACGGSIYVSGISNSIQSNTFDNASASSQGILYNNESAGGAVYMIGDSSIFQTNIITSSFASTEEMYHSGWNTASGGALYISGSNIIVSENQFINNGIYFEEEHDDTYSYLAGNFYRGGAVFLSGNNVQYEHNLHIGNDAAQGNGGGLYINANEVYVHDNTFYGNIASRGGGIYVNQDMVQLDFNIITNNTAVIDGNGLYGGRIIKNNIIKHNLSPNLSSACGLIVDAHTDSIHNNNINHNTGFQVKHTDTNPVEASNNWWFTRSEEEGLANAIFDGEDSLNLGLISINPHLTNVSTTTPFPLETIISIQPKDDFTFSNDLVHTIRPGDTLYFAIHIVDPNPFNRDVTTVSVTNLSNMHTIHPFFEESTDSSGVLHGYIITSDNTDQPWTIMASEGDSLVIASELDDSHSFGLVIGDPEENNPPYIIEPIDEIFLTEDFEPYHMSLGQHYNDYEGDVLEYSILENQGGFDVEIIGNDLVVSNHADWFGTGWTALKISDGNTNLDDTIQVNISSVDDLPVWDLPELILLASSDTLSMSLDSVLIDIDTGLDSIEISWTGNVMIAIERDSTLLHFHPNNPEWYGYEDIVLNSTGIIDTLRIMVQLSVGPPTPFNLLSPGIAEIVDTRNPILVWSASTSPNINDSIVYQVELGTVQMPHTIFITSDTSIFIEDEMGDNSSYYWRVTASNRMGQTTTNMGGFQTFTINIGNDAPSIVNLISPDSVMILTLTPSLYWTAATDVDPGDSISYEIKWWLSDIESDSILTDTNAIDIPNELQDNSLYHWQVRAQDLSGRFSESSQAMFWTDLHPESPGTFELLSPGNDTTGLPSLFTLNWESSIDPDPLDFVEYTVQIANDSLFADIEYEAFTGTVSHYEMPIDLDVNAEYWWRVIARDTDSLSTTSSPFKFTVGYVVSSSIDVLPEKNILKQNFPNPFNPSTNLRIGLVEASRVSLIIYDILGREVLVLMDNSEQSAGWYDIPWHGLNSSGESVAAGLYFGVLEVTEPTGSGLGRYHSIIKMMLLQ